MDKDRQGIGVAKRDIKAGEDIRIIFNLHKNTVESPDVELKDFGINWIFNRIDLRDLDN